MMKDDCLDSIRHFCERNYVPYTTPKGKRVVSEIEYSFTINDENLIKELRELFMEDKMRFETVKIENETINYVYGDIYTIKDNVDDDSPVNTFRLLKTSADNVCKWLNELVGEEVKSFGDKVKEAIDYLWDDDEYHYFVVDGMHIIMEVKESFIGVNQLREALPDAIITYKDIGSYKAIFFISEGK